VFPPLIVLPGAAALALNEQAHAGKASVAVLAYRTSLIQPIAPMPSDGKILWLLPRMILA